MPRADPNTHLVDAASRLLRDRYGLSGVLHRLDGENVNFLVEPGPDHGDGSPCVLKIADARGIDASLVLEDASASHLAGRVAVSIPVSIAGRDGAAIATIDDPPLGPACARLARFVTGTAWHEVTPRSPALRAHAGRTLAELHRAFDDFDHPAAARSHPWDLARAGAHRAALRSVGRADRRALLETVYQGWSACSQTELDACPTGFIHGDYHDGNVLVRADRVVGVIDFGDALVNPIVCDLAIALAYLTIDEDDPLAAGADLVAGYDGVRALRPVEQSVLFALMMTRLAVSVTISACRRAEDPTRSAWFETEPRAWRVLERLIRVDPATATGILTARCAKRSASLAGAPIETLLDARRRTIGSNLSVAYDEPLKIVRGRGAYLVASDGRPYLDLVNNVCHVGHCHPHVVAAGQRQMALLNTNSRYVYDGYTDYAQRLVATLPDPLNVCYLVNSGSEANELAVRLARAHTGRRDLVVLESAYHGHTGMLIEMSPYKFRGPGGTRTAAPWVHVAPMPDVYRGPHRAGPGESTHAAGAAYADALARVIADAGAPIAGFICESLLSCGGQIVLPDGYLGHAYEHVRAAGGVCIADEVQVGFGRVGDTFWGFELQDVVPDIVVMGKPIGNGHPLAAVVTTPAIADSFANGMEFFSTFGGNPVSCAIGLAVLDVVDEEGLQAHAKTVGDRLCDGLVALQSRHALIGDVRGRGLFLGVELVRDHATLEPADREAHALVNAMRQRGILLSTDGPLHNVIKIKPPLVLSEGDADMVVRRLDEAFAAHE